MAQPEGFRRAFDAVDFTTVNPRRIEHLDYVLVMTMPHLNIWHQMLLLSWITSPSNAGAEITFETFCGIMTMQL